jgi:chromosome partitioning protein
MQIIVVASQKGGSGKTTLTGHLAVEAGRAGFGPVALVDTDPQGSLNGWWEQREDPLPSLIQSSFEIIEEDLSKLYEQGHRLAVIDTPPAATSAISEIVRVADLVIAPVRPSPHDLRAVGATVDIVERWQKPLIFIVNGGIKKARITSEAAVALSQHGTVAPTTLHHRVDFAASMIDGRTVMETKPEGASAKEVIAVWQYIAERLSKIRGPLSSPSEFETMANAERQVQAPPLDHVKIPASPPPQVESPSPVQMQSPAETPTPEPMYEPVAEPVAMASASPVTGSETPEPTNRPAPVAFNSSEDRRSPPRRVGLGNGGIVHRPTFGRRSTDRNL